ncbi:DUF5777 family beta-barrel protein [Mucilaginibacter gotjawali]|uniref:DUF5777 domain-containing protein n=1 Tax=Mucilaginibacter gotjawali TaxID=1550579 RepID=A0A839SP10_9SPHI|nr:DUF5777 family beta-barrel protein [Mucilaginibacter gotjawali]MBB3058944.1 hypothetical protein [Mucilaginibacter gotjawali]
MKTFIITAAFLMTCTGLIGQATDTSKATSLTDSLFNMMDKPAKNERVIVFDASRLILSQSSETVKKNNFNFLVIHRFGDFAGHLGGGKYFYGIDAVADVYIGFEYGLSNDLNIDFGRSTVPLVGGLVDVELKYALLHQNTGGGSPIAITVLGQTGIRTYNSFNSFGDRLSYFAQAIFARRFSPDFSLQVAPSILQNNLPIPDLTGNSQAFVSLSATAHLKVSKLMSIIVDYAHPFSSFRNGTNGFSDPLGLGLQVVTGGHVFTVNVTNARAVSEINYLSNTTSDLSRGQYRLGFTISRMFDFSHKEKYNPHR